MNTTQFCGSMWWMCPIVMGIVLVIVVSMIVCMRRRGGCGMPAWMGGGRPSAGETPLDVLKMRYAKGEITKDEFERMKKDIG